MMTSPDPLPPIVRPARASLTTNVGWLAATSLLVKPAWFVFLLLTARRLGPGEFGTYMTALALVSLVAVLLDFGLDTYIVRGLATAPETFATVYSQSLRIKVASGVLLAGLVMAVSRWIGGQGLAPSLLVATILFGAANLLLLHLRAPFRAFEILRYEAISIAWEKLGMIALGACALIWRPTATGFMAATAAAYVLATALTLRLLVRRVGRPGGSFSAGTLWSAVLKPALPFALMNAFSIIYFRSGTLLLSGITHRADLVGQYNAGYRLVESYMLIPVLVATPLYPVLTRRLAAAEPVRDLLFNSVRAILPVTVLVALGLLWLAPGFTQLLFGPEFRGGALAVGLVSLSMIPVGLNFIFGTLVAAAGRQSRSNLFIAVITLVNIGLNLWLIPRHGVIGAALTTVATEALLTLSHLWVGRDLVPWREGGLLVLRLGGAALLTGLGTLYVTPTWLFPARLVLLVALFSVSCVALGILGRSDLHFLLARFRSDAPGAAA